MKKEYVMSEEVKATIENLRAFTAGKKYNTIYADPPWQFQNRTGKIAPEHKRLNRYPTMGLEDICALPLKPNLVKLILDQLGTTVCMISLFKILVIKTVILRSTLMINVSFRNQSRTGHLLQHGRR